MTADHLHRVSQQFSEPGTVVEDAQPVGRVGVTQTVRYPPLVQLTSIRPQSAEKIGRDQRWRRFHQSQPCGEGRIYLRVAGLLPLGLPRFDADGFILPEDVIPIQTLRLGGTKTGEEVQRDKGDQRPVGGLLDPFEDPAAVSPPKRSANVPISWTVRARLFFLVSSETYSAHRPINWFTEAVKGRGLLKELKVVGDRVHEGLAVAAQLALPALQLAVGDRQRDLVQSLDSVLFKQVPDLPSLFE